MESVPGNVRKATETEDVPELGHNGGSSAAVPTASVTGRKNGLPRSRRRRSAPEERGRSIWAYIYIILTYVRTRTPPPPLINVRNRFAGWSFPGFKTAKRSDASSQTDPPPVRETRAVSSQTVAPAHANAATQTVPSATGTVAVQTVTPATSTAAAQTDATHSHATAVQTDETSCVATSVQTDARPCVVVASQTDVHASTAVAAVQTDRTTGRDTGAVHTERPNVVPGLVYNTFSQTDPPATFCQTVAAQTDSPATFCKTVAAQTDSPATFCKTVAAQTDSPVTFCQTVAAQTDSPATFCQTVAAQTDPPVTFCQTVAAQTDPPPSAGETIAVRTDSAPREDDGDNGKRSSAAVQEAHPTADADDGKRSSAAVQEAHPTTDADDGKRTDPRDAAAVSVGVQTDEPACETVKNPRKDSSVDAVNELLAKFGRGDHKARAADKNRVSLKSVLKKIELNGFKSLSFQEMSFTHQQIIDNSVALCNKYKSLIEIAVKHLPSWQRGSIKQKHDIIHVFATLDKVLDSKNNELNTYTKLIETVTPTNSFKNNVLIRASPYDDIMAGKFLRRPEKKDVIKKKSN